MITSWSLRLLTVMTGTLLIASTTADSDILTKDVLQYAGPVIRPISDNNQIILEYGQNYTLYCKGKNPLQFKQQEIPEEGTDQFYMKQRNLTSDDQSEYELALDLYNVDEFAVGYYACFDDTVDSEAALTNIYEEPNNTAHISYIYVYVNGSRLLAPMRTFVIATKNSLVIECRPTTPDIKVNLTLDFADVRYDRYNPKVGFTIDSDVLANVLTSIINCEFARQDYIETKEVIVHKPKVTLPQQPKIFGGSEYFLKDETFTINCSVDVEQNSPVVLTWSIPGEIAKVTKESNELYLRGDVLYNNYTIRNADKYDAGIYVCTSKNNFGTNSTYFEKKFLERPMIEMVKSNVNNPIEPKERVLRVTVAVNAYPQAEIRFFRDNQVLLNSAKFTTKIDPIAPNRTLCVLTIKSLDVEDTGNYTVMARNAFLTNFSTFDVRKPGAPKAQFASKGDKKFLKNTRATIVCEAIGYPLPEIIWSFSSDEGNIEINKTYQIDTPTSLIKITSLLNVNRVLKSGALTCRARNKMGENSTTARFLVYEMADGFGIENSNQTWFSEGQDVVLKCIASKYDFSNITWYGLDDVIVETAEYSENPLSLIAKLKLDGITLDQAGNYTCMGLRLNETEDSKTITITVAGSREPEIVDPEDKTVEVLPFQPINYTCTADAVPPPRIEWYKDEEPVYNNDNLEITNNYSDHSTVNSMIKIAQMQEENIGKYECRAVSSSGVQSKYYSLLIKEKASHKATYLSVIGVIFFVLIVLVVYLAWKIRKEKEFRKELAAAGLLNFKDGVTKSINPDLGIDEQAELLPYDEKFEFPPEKLVFGKQLGAGAFGVVYKAEARGIVNAEETTTVAVKMVKKTADNMYIKALASELKIMVHLGKHVNIVNLLGACTNKVGKRELIVIVEYCKYGNIHNYMQKHREVFIDQLTDNPEKNLGKINRGYSCSSGNSGSHSDYFGSNHTQETDHTFLNSANTNRSGRKVSETGYVQPEWRSNYVSDYSFDGRNPRPLYSRDLLAWAFQIARGMEYLASRKVLHGDLAARNVLLTDDNIVKICDFGLARSIYKNDEYQKQENSLLPVKWLAIECMMDRIFSTQSDVWSFGIVLWELFSLAKTPYPNFSPPSLLQWLSDGHRLAKPPYADDRLYDVMLRCWEHKPTARPTFSQLQLILGSFLEDNVRNHYVDLNAAYMDMNVKREGEEDYLAMVCAPDYNNLVTPSPHHYVNESRNFFPPTPTQLQHDDEGYLQMSPATRQTIFNARAQGTKFDFDARKLTPRVSEPNSYGSELTPMLTLNNLPRNGSESDHEGNSSPYLNMCPRIEEETDEVFETKQNNAKNIQPSAVTNPTYIKFSADDEKKNQNFTNSYINVPNGLVK